MSPRPSPTGYSRLQIALHWTIAAMVIFQLVVNRGMQQAFDDRMDGDMVEDGMWALIHIAIGVTVLILAVVRVLVRLTRGAPRPHDDKPQIINLIGWLTHLALYGFIFAMPLTGALAWFGWNEASAEIHELGRFVLIPLILLHVAGGLVEHFWFRNDTLKRMVKPQDG